MKDLFLKIVRFLFGIKTETKQCQLEKNEEFVIEYKDIKKINFNAIFSNKFSKYTVAESKITIDGDNKRAKYINDFIQKMWKKLKKITNLSYGCGGVALIPFVQNNKLYYKFIEQNRLSIDKTDGELITAATILAETKTITNSISTKTYLRWSNYKVVNNSLIITQKYTDRDGEKIATPEFWLNIKPQMVITNVDRVLIGFIKSPIDNRDSDDKYGVPITYGCKHTIDEIYECLEQIVREFKLKETFVGADLTLFKDENKLTEKGLYKKINGTKDDFWEVFDPAIRDSSFYARLQELYTRLENEIGTSRGILTKVDGANVTATETKRNMFDSFTIVSDMRTNIESGISDFIYSCDKLCDAYNLCPSGDYETKYDWDYSLLENSQETFNQINTGISKGYAKKVEGRQFLYPSETLEESEKAIEEIKQSDPGVKELVGE